MRSLSRCIEKITHATHCIDEAIKLADPNVLAVTTVNQLEHFKQKLEVVLDLVERNDLPEKQNRDLGISRVIVDQWPYDSKLGVIIVEAEQAFKGL
ncbi:hypothetical protein ALP83_02906 [Pseudomonas syringae pv. actinidiae]|uniref:Uncharacterized protein n=1 Tax=Pseudomonas syringae pv. actinidiae TaxID=103796 RepID=A0A7Z6UFM0_PSESF|nr:hypothetical protein ALP83_02906 [Pseudomonas syringae pv. actinidiae]